MDAVTGAVRGLAGQHLVRPDGTVGLGAYGSAHVDGLTAEQAADALATRLKAAGAAGGLTLRQLEESEPGHMHRCLGRLEIEERGVDSR